MSEHSETATILVVDDEPPLLRLIARVLEKEGHKVLTACDGTEAVELFDAHFDDISGVVLDVVIPPNGVGEVLDHMLAARDDLPLVLSSGDTPSPDVAERVEGRCGAAFLRKPFLPRALLETVDRSLAAAKGGSGSEDAAARDAGGGP